MAPAATTKFHICDFQSNLKKSDNLPPPTAHMVLKFELIPKDLPKNKSKYMINEIINPLNHHGHGLTIKNS